MKDNAADRKLKIAFLVGIALLILLPLAFFHAQKDELSPTENRRLAAMSTLRAEDGAWNDAFFDEFSLYVSDRIGWRQTFVRTASRIKLYGFQQSPSDDIHVGKDGWYYYKGNRNLDIASGVFPLGDKELENIAANQIAVQEYYAAKGARFFVMVNPSKVSVYPEYIRGGDFSARETPADLITEKLKSDTDVPVINPKSRLLENKGLDALYLKQDSHWNTLGSYIAYEEILSVMQDAGVVSDETPIAVEIVTEDYGTGEFSDYFGDILPREFAPAARYEPKATEVTSGAFYDEVRAICEANSDKDHDLMTNFAIFENPRAPSGTLLIYGDSQISAERKIPNYLAEHFRTVVNVGIVPAITEPLDDFLAPDAVLYAISERRSDVLFYQFGIYGQ